MSKYDNIPSRLNTPAQQAANSHDQHSPVSTPAQRIEQVPGSRAGCDVLRAAMPSLTGEAEEAARRQINARK